MPLLSSSSSSSSSPFTLSSSSSSSSFHILRLQFPSRSLLLSPPLPPPRSSSLLRSTPKPPPPPLLRIAAAAMASSDSGVAGAGNADPRIPRIASSIRVIPNFPKPGVMFQDITTLLLDHKAFKDAIDMFVERYRDKGITVVAGIEARGFIFGGPIALAIGAKFVPMRKPNKLPGEVISEEYSLEYGTDRMEMHVGAVEPEDRALIIDDLIATGGTLCAAIRLLERVGADVVECACVIELPELKGREKLGDRPLFVLVEAA
ncbi:adenine phosphoribosyltransferase 1-like [Ananas comosus]|uniref:adenine phosphoribosyltransferase n=1 Tax=Ananas comosus TaxID=4615 RepID=A0A6P5ERD5_ANACO|nr:adenine phosphoribosyltransferase 1-like [Ananas comosus]